MAQGAGFHAFHQGGENVAPAAGGILEGFQGGGAGGGMGRLKICQPADLGLLLLRGGAGEPFSGQLYFRLAAKVGIDAALMECVKIPPMDLGGDVKTSSPACGGACPEPVEGD